MEYSFDIELAIKHGVNESILIRQFAAEVMRLRSEKENQIDGRTWIKAKTANLGKLFPFWKNHQIRHLIDKLVDKEILLKENHNSNKNDTTNWFAFNKEDETIKYFSRSIYNNIYSNNPAPPKKTSGAESRPESLEKAVLYFKEMKATTFKNYGFIPVQEAEKFFDHFKSNGWKVGGKSPMKDWKAAVRNWIRNSSKPTGGTPVNRKPTVPKQ